MAKRRYRRNHMAEIRRARGILRYGEKIKHLLSPKMIEMLERGHINIAKSEIIVKEIQEAKRGTVTLSDMDEVFAALDLVQAIYNDMKKQVTDLQTALRGVDDI